MARIRARAQTQRMAKVRALVLSGVVLVLSAFPTCWVRSASAQWHSDGVISAQALARVDSNACSSDAVDAADAKCTGIQG